MRFYDSEYGSLLFCRHRRLHKKDDEPDRSDDRDQVDEDPRPALADIVESSHAHAESRKKKGEGDQEVDNVKNQHDNRHLGKNRTENAENKSDEEKHKGILPELRAVGASFEFHILVEDNILEVGDNVVYKLLLSAKTF